MASAKNYLLTRYGLKQMREYGRTSDEVLAETGKLRNKTVKEIERYIQVAEECDRETYGRQA